MTNKSNQFEARYADNFKPNLVEKFIKANELFRADAMAELMSDRVDVLVDLACGDGDFIYKYGNNFKNAIGIDISKKRIANAKKKLKPIKARLIVSDLNEGIPLKDSSVNTVVCEASIGCLYDTEQFLFEVHRVLRPGGEFIVQIGNYAYFPRRLALLFGILPKISAFRGYGDGGMIRYFTYPTLRNLLLSAGFNITGESNSGVLAKLRRVWPTLLAPDIIIKAEKK